MPRFRVIVTRDTTESAFVTVEAEDVDEAHDLAINQALISETIAGPHLGYERDECACSEPYITGCDEEDDDA